jgi:hypothetical protein
MSQNPTERRQFSRRRFLGSTLAVAGVATLPLGMDAAGASMRPRALSRSALPVGPPGSSVVRPTYSPLDGLLETFVRAPVTSITPDVLALTVPAGMGLRTETGPIYVSVVPETFVHARGVDVQGDISSLEEGDVLSIGTAYDPSGTRTAAWIVANMQIVNFQVSSIAEPDAHGPLLQKQTIDTGITARLTVPPSCAAVLESNAGDYWSAICSRDIADSDEVHLWVINAGSYFIDPA